MTPMGDMFFAAKVETLSAVAPLTAKFAPCLKLPSLSKYGSRKGRSKAWAVIMYVTQKDDK